MYGCHTARCIHQTRDARPLTRVDGPEVAGARDVVAREWRGAVGGRCREGDRNGVAADRCILDGGRPRRYESHRRDNVTGGTDKVNARLHRKPGRVCADDHQRLSRVRTRHVLCQLIVNVVPPLRGMGYGVARRMWLGRKKQ